MQAWVTIAFSYEWYLVSSTDVLSLRQLKILDATVKMLDIPLNPHGGITSRWGWPRTFDGQVPVFLLLLVWFVCLA